MMDRKRIIDELLSQDWGVNRIHISDEVLFQKDESHERCLFKSFPEIGLIRYFNDSYTVIIHFADYGPVAVHYSSVRKKDDKARYKVKVIIDAPHLFPPITGYLGLFSGVNEKSIGLKANDEEILNAMTRSPDLCWKEILALPVVALAYVHPKRRLLNFLTGKGGL